MKRQITRWMLLAVMVVMGLLIRPLRAEIFEKTMTAGGMSVGGGPQNMNTVENILNRNFRAEAEKRGYIVVAPAAQDNRLFFLGGARIFPDFLKAILADYKIKDDKFHIAGPSNGGIASLHVAAANPQYFLSVTAFPGYMWGATEAKLEAISKMCIFMYVGEFDPYMWHDEMEGKAEYLRSLGAVAQYTVEKNQPHRLETLSGDNAGRLFDGFEEAQKCCGGK
jgi:hypothetical protein